MTGTEPASSGPRRVVRQNNVPLSPKTRTTRGTSSKSKSSRSSTTTLKPLPPTPTFETTIPIRRRRSKHATSRDPNRRNEPNSTHRILAREEHIHQHFRDTFFQQKHYVRPEDPFEEIFDCPIDENICPEPTNASRALDECVRLFQLGEAVNMDPMGRFFATPPRGEHAFVTCRHLLVSNTRDVDDGRERHREHAVQEVQQLAAETSQTTAAPQPRDPLTDDENPRKQQRHPRRHHLPGESWLELSDSESESTSSTKSVASSRTRVPAERWSADTGEMMRALIATFQTVD